ncbi:YIP1 family protein [Pelagovum pacificum]|nr:YIP1 family protein [Pelagovum pacificum]QQA44695.1 YIP1 family protein [Pelagovum pacificum]
MLRLMVATVQDPPQVARGMFGLGLPRSVLWPALALVVILSVLLVALASIVLPPVPRTESTIMLTPMSYTLILAGLLTISVFALNGAAQMLGGHGRFEDSLLTVIWVTAIQVVAQAIQIVLTLAAPFLSVVFLTATLVVSLWVLVHFINEAHKFNSLGRAFMTIVVSVIGVIVGSTMLLSLISAIAGRGVF